MQVASILLASKCPGSRQHVHCCNPYDNAKSESFFKMLKREEVSLKQFQTFQEGENTIRECIEEVYNTKRLHASLSSMPPTKFEEA